MEKPKDREIECSLNKEQEEQRIYAAMACLNLIGASRTIPNALEKKKDSLGDLVRALLKVDRIERGRITCTFTVNPTFANTYNTLHGGAVGVISEAVALGCVRSVAGDKNFFLGEWAASYLSAAALKEEVQVEGVVVRHGRTVIVTSVEFRIKQTRKLIYGARATFYSIPVSHL